MRDIRPQTPRPAKIVPPPLPEDALPAPTSNTHVQKKVFQGKSVPVAHVHVPRAARRVSQPTAPAHYKTPRPLFAPKEIFEKKEVTRGQSRLGYRERKVVLAFLVLVLLAGGLALYIFLPTATIALNITSAPLLVDQKLNITSAVVAGANNVPGSVFAREENVEGDVAVQSTEVIGTKTIGEVTLVNRTLTEQKIKEGSRLVSNDGKLFYMQKPAFLEAAVSNSPATTTVTVEAAEAGPEYNLDKQKLNFAALDKPSQTLVYGEIRTKLAGGSGSVVKIVKDADLDQTKKIAQDNARTEAEQDIRQNLLKDWVLLDESWQVTNAEITPDKKANDKADTIHYKAKVSLRVMGYEKKSLEDKLRQALDAKLDKDYMLSSDTISYTKTLESVDWEQGQAAVSVRVTHTTIPKISFDALKDKISGLNSQDATAYLQGLPGVKSASLQLWPFWASTVPRITNRIIIDINPQTQQNP